MAEYIDKQAVEEMIESAQLISDGEYSGYCTEDINISSIHAADVAPVVHGRWISKNPHGYEWVFVCSNCDYVDGYPFNDRSNYCPNCGAKMDEKENDK